MYSEVASLREDTQLQHGVGVLRLDAVQNILNDFLLSQFDYVTAPDIAANIKASTLNDVDYVSIRKAERLYRSHESNWTDANGQKKEKSKKAQAKSVSLRRQLVALLNSYFEKLDADTVAALQQLTAADLDRYKVSSGFQFICGFTYSEAAAKKDLRDAATSRAAANIPMLKQQCKKLKSELIEWQSNNPLTAAAAATDAAVRLTSTAAVTSDTVAHLYNSMNCENAVIALDHEKRLLTVSAAADITHNCPLVLVHQTHQMIKRYQLATARTRHVCNTNTVACRELLTEIQTSLLEDQEADT
jgi:hypothetical protein